MKRCSMLWLWHHFVKAMEVSSLPLSCLRTSGFPCYSISCCITRMPRKFVIELSAIVELKFDLLALLYFDVVGGEEHFSVMFLHDHFDRSRRLFR